MACSREFYVRNKYTGENVRVPCRWCMSCRVDSRESWADRFNFERLFAAHQGFASSYVTFTYDDEHYPRNGSLSKKEGQKFIFRLRQQLKYHEIPLPSNGMKYILVGEYGGKTGRVHIHGLFSGLDCKAALPIYRKVWPHGIIESLPLLPGAVRYVLKYVDKQQHGDEIEQIYKEHCLEPPYMLRSQSIGLDYFNRNKQYILDHGGYYHLGKIRPLTQYYRRLLGPDNLNTAESQKQDYNNFLTRMKFAASNGLTLSKLNEIQAYNLERKLIFQARENGLSVDDSYLKNLSPEKMTGTEILGAIETLKQYEKYGIG